MAEAMPPVGDDEAVERMWPKFSQFQAYYASRTMTPFKCRRCRWWVKPEDSADRLGKCRIVEETGPPANGEIAPDATCTLWNSGLIRQGIQEITRGRGTESKGLLPGTLRHRLEQTVVPGPHSEPPPEVKARLIFKRNPLARGPRQRSR